MLLAFQGTYLFSVYVVPCGSWLAPACKSHSVIFLNQCSNMPGWQLEISHEESIFNKEITKCCILWYSFSGEPVATLLATHSAVLCLVTQWCLTLCYPMDCSPPGPSVHGDFLQARILEWVAMPSSGGSSQPRDWTQVSRIASRFFTAWATREAQEYWSG